MFLVAPLCGPNRSARHHPRHHPSDGPLDPVNAEYRIVFAPLGGQESEVAKGCAEWVC
jgi:hypothetical protein